MELDLDIIAAATLTDSRGKTWRLRLADDRRISIRAPAALRPGTLDLDDLANAIEALADTADGGIKAKVIAAREINASLEEAALEHEREAQAESERE